MLVVDHHLGHSVHGAKQQAHVVEPLCLLQGGQPGRGRVARTARTAQLCQLL